MRRAGAASRGGELGRRAGEEWGGVGCRSTSPGKLGAAGRAIKWRTCLATSAPVLWAPAAHAALHCVLCRYFARIAEERMGPEDQAIIALHCPTWLVDWFWGTTKGANLRQLIRGPLRGRARMTIAGTRARMLGRGWGGPHQGPLSLLSVHCLKPQACPSIRGSACGTHACAMCMCTCACVSGHRCFPFLPARSAEHACPPACHPAMQATCTSTCATPSSPTPPAPRPACAPPSRPPRCARLPGHRR